MNHQTETLINEAINSLSDSAFNQQQINSLIEVILKISEAIEKECKTQGNCL